jgi:hypothetical protein
MGKNYAFSETNPCFTNISWQGMEKKAAACEIREGTEEMRDAGVIPAANA